MILNRVFISCALILGLGVPQIFANTTLCKQYLQWDDSTFRTFMSKNPNSVLKTLSSCQEAHFCANNTSIKNCSAQLSTRLYLANSEKLFKSDASSETEALSPAENLPNEADAATLSQPPAPVATEPVTALPDPPNEEKEKNLLPNSETETPSNAPPQNPDINWF